MSQTIFLPCYRYNMLDSQNQSVVAHDCAVGVKPTSGSKWNAYRTILWIDLTPVSGWTLDSATLLWKINCYGGGFACHLRRIFNAQTWGSTAITEFVNRETSTPWTCPGADVGVDPAHSSATDTGAIAFNAPASVVPLLPNPDAATSSATDATTLTDAAAHFITWFGATALLGETVTTYDQGLVITGYTETVLTGSAGWSGGGYPAAGGRYTTGIQDVLGGASGLLALVQDAMTSRAKQFMFHIRKDDEAYPSGGLDHYFTCGTFPPVYPRLKLTGTPPQAIYLGG